MDDVRPGRYCSSDYIGKSDYLMVIPMFDNISIAENKTWCSQILALNKTLGMHGITHAPDEFSHDLNESYIIGGIEEFNKCFGKYPEIFTAPEFELSKSNAEFIKSRGIRINGWSFALTHKVYHCVDEGKTSYLEKVNRIVDIL
jgi:predicted deacetylase